MCFVLSTRVINSNGHGLKANIHKKSMTKIHTTDIEKFLFNDINQCYRRQLQICLFWKSLIGFHSLCFGISFTLFSIIVCLSAYLCIYILVPQSSFCVYYVSHTPKLIGWINRNCSSSFSPSLCHSLSDFCYFCFGLIFILFHILLSFPTSNIVSANCPRLFTWRVEAEKHE